MITGQGNGQGGREHGQKCDQLPGQRSHHRSRARASTSPACGASRPTNCRGPGYTAVEIMNAIHARRDQGRCSRSASTRWSRCPTRTSRARRWRSWSSSASSTSSSRRRRTHADVVLAGSLQEEEEGVTANVEGARASTSRRPWTRPASARRFRDHLRPGAPPGQAASTSRTATPREIFEELRAGLARRHRRLLRHHLREDRPADGRLLAVPDARSSRARRACSKAAVSSTPTARRIS